MSTTVRIKYIKHLLHTQFLKCVYFWHSNWKYFAATDLIKRIGEYSWGRNTTLNVADFNAMCIASQ